MWFQPIETVTVVYDPLALLQTRNGEGMNEEGEVLPYEKAAAYVRKLLVYYTGDLMVNEPRVVKVPVCYGGEYGADLKQASERAGISEADFAARHADGHYLVAMIGFMPGFPYLTGLPQQLSQPRRASPRSSVPAGSVGIAGGQTGIYPLTAPGDGDSSEEHRSIFLIHSGDRLPCFKPVIVYDSFRLIRSGWRSGERHRWAYL